MAVTLKLAVAPTVTVWFTGWDVMLGAVAAAFTVSVALVEVALPALLVTRTEKVEALSPITVAGVV